ncbi:MAG: rhodanese-like domain-containing protein [Nocardioidaceae bacterium]
MSPSVLEIGVSELPAAVPSDSILVLDVREDDEWRAGHIEAAVHIPMAAVPARVDELPADRQILVVCRSGARSGQVTGYLAGQGWDAVNLAGGMKAWAAAGRQMSSADAAAPRVL